MRYFILFLLIFTFSCSQKTTQEQRDKYEECKNNLSGYLENLKRRDPSISIPDSTKQLFNDISSMELEDLVEKYEVPTNEIDNFIQSVCVANEIQSAFEKLDQKLKESDKIINENRDKLNAQFEIMKNLKPLELKHYKLIKINGEDYAISNGDTIKVIIK